MSEVLRCDVCGAVQHEDASVGWVRVEPLGVDTPTFDTPGPPYHFCSRPCLMDWAGGAR